MSVFSVVRLDSRIRWVRSVVRSAPGADRGLDRPGAKWTHDHRPKPKAEVERSVV